MKKVLLEAPILTNSGYGEHARLVFEALMASDEQLEVYVNPLPWGTCTEQKPSPEIKNCIQNMTNLANYCQQNKVNPSFDLHIHVGIPNEFQKKAPRSVCVTAGIETDRISAEWVFKTNEGVDKLIVPSEHSKSVFMNTKYEVINNKTKKTEQIVRCECPVEVVPYPVKTPVGSTLDIDFDTDFNFLSVAMAGTRKNIQFSIECFVDQFRDNPDVGLVLKTSLSRSSVMDRIETRKQLSGFVKSLGPKKCKVYVIHGNLEESEIHSLYTHPKIKAYYTTTHGEGYGLPIFESVYNGLPVIATDWSGHLDFLHGKKKGKVKKLFAAIQYDLKQVQTSAVWKDIITEDSRWAYPTASSTKRQLESVYKNYGMYKGWAKTLQKQVEENFSKDKIIKKMLDNLLEISAPLDVDENEEVMVL